MSALDAPTAATGGALPLDEWQRRLAGALTAPGAWTGAPVELGLRPDLPAMRRLGIHRRNIRGARVQALSATFSRCRRVLGAEVFEALAIGYAADRPSLAPDIAQAGAGFPLFIARRLSERVTTDTSATVFIARRLSERVTTDTSATGWPPYLADLARLEWALHRASQAAEPARFDWSAADAAGPDARPRLHPALARFDTVWPTALLATTRGRATERLLDDAEHHRGAAPGERAGLSPIPDGPPSDEPTTLVVSRAANGEVTVEAVDPGTATLLEAISSGTTLSALLAAGQAARVPALVQRGWVVGLDRPAAQRPNAGRVA